MKQKIGAREPTRSFLNFVLFFFTLCSPALISYRDSYSASLMLARIISELVNGRFNSQNPQNLQSFVSPCVLQSAEITYCIVRLYRFAWTIGASLQTD
jgi:hypothetical protein